MEVLSTRKSDVVLRTTFRTWFSLVWVSVLLGCSIKEERDDCPCRLFLDFTSVDVSLRSSLSFLVTSADGFLHEAVVANEDTCVIDVPKIDLQIGVWSGDRGCVKDGNMIIPKGNDCPRVYAHFNRLYADGEAVYETVRLRKMHCLLTVGFDEPYDVASMVIRGNVNGFDRYGYPSKGEFCVESEIDSRSDIPFTFCIPRQYGDPLYLDVVDSGGGIRTFPLHEYIRIAGYDWSAPDLNDLNLKLYLTKGKVSVIVMGWKEEIFIDVVI